jgi:hypothetical protein
LALFLHLVGALLFVGGIVVAGIAHSAARRRERASEVAIDHILAKLLRHHPDDIELVWP